MFGFLLQKVLPDQNLQEKYIQESNLDYTIIRPSALTAGPISNYYLFGSNLIYNNRESLLKALITAYFVVMIATPFFALSP